MRHLASLLLCLGLATAARAADSPAPSAFDPKGSDPGAIAIVDRMQQALGMPDSWKKAHYMEFTFTQARNDTVTGKGRHHCWDTWTGRYRVEGFSRQLGKPYVVIYGNIEDPASARVWVDGQEQTADTTRLKFGKQLRGAFINDSYWLLMPYKMKDPGVHLKSMGVMNDSTTTMKPCDVVQMSFDNVGMTPRDHYWVWIDQASHRVSQWRYFSGDSPTIMTTGWDGYETDGSLTLSGKRHIDGEPNSIVLKDLVVSEQVKEAAFTGP